MAHITEAFNASVDAGVSIDCIDLSYSVMQADKPKKLLREVSFSVGSGKMVALMGPSGAGKSTLLDLLANRKMVGNWSGEIFINKAGRSKFFRRDHAYVLQDDVHIATLTVVETIYNAAWTRLPEGTSHEDIQKRVDLLLDMMSMNHVRDNIVGDGLHKGISGGQLKRLSIAVEIVALPDLIFLDEPTSGLDSSISLEVMNVVRQLANQNRLCISTIHQPSPEVFGLFDDVVLVSAGRMIYFGTVDSVIPYLTSPQLGYRYNGTQNPAEFMIDVSNGQIFPHELRIPRNPEELEQIYKRSPYYQPPPQTGLFGTSEAADKLSKHTSLYATGFVTQSQMLFRRTWIAAIRDRRDQSAQLMKNFFVGVMIGIVFWDQAAVSLPLYNDDYFHTPNSEVLNISSLLFFGMCYVMIGNLQAIPYLCLRNQIYRRELASNAYNPAPYWAAASLTNVPILFVNHFVFVIIVYFTAGLPNNAEYFFYFFFLLFLAALNAYYAAMFLAAATGSQQMAFSLFPLSFLFFTTFSGFAIAVNSVPSIWIWAPFVTFARYTFQGLMVNQWGSYDDDNGDVLSQYDFNDFNKNDAFPINLLFMAFFMAICYYAMLPTKSKLKKVDNLEETMVETGVTITTKSITSFRTVTQEILGVDKASLKEGLLASGAVGNQSVLEIEEEGGGFKAQTTYDVAWYRQNTRDVLDASGMRVSFSNLHYQVLAKDGKTWLPLLRGVTGKVSPGEMCALMGASGAGKSTLLDVIAGRKNKGEITGEILFNGRAPNSSVMKNTAYVMQDNVHYGVLTVRESLYFAAEFRLLETMSVEDKKAAVDKILDMLGLTEVADTLVGDHNIRGISGGQLKRLSIAVEIVSLPDVIFLDEPTTGLDSAISYEVMAAVRNMCNQNRTIMCTIHQPSPQTYLLFDKLLLLAEGRVIYFGPSRDVVNYFVTCPYQFYYKPGSNPADYVIAVAGSFLVASNGQKVSGSELAALYASSDIYQALVHSVEKTEGEDKERSEKELTVANESGDYYTSTLHQVKTLMARVLLRTSKNLKVVVIVPLLRHCIVGLFYGSIFYMIPNGTATTDYTDRLALFFFSIMFVVIGHQQSIPMLQDDRLIFYRERGAKAYGAFPYWISLWLHLLPLTIINVMAFTLLEYNLTGMRSGAKYFGAYYYALLFSSFTGIFVSQTISALASSTQAALSLFPTILFFSCAFSGFIVYLPDFPPWLGNWAPYLSFFRWAFQTMVLDQFTDNSELVEGSAFIGELGFESMNMTQTGSLIIIFVVFFALCELAALKYVDFEDR